MKNFWQKIDKPILALAPMAGITDSAFRQICRLHGADVTYSEMASVSALFYKPQKTLELVRFKKYERPYVVQLFGNNPKHFATATKIITKKVKPDGIDINFGCPAKKVFKHGSGCALMPQIELAREIISAVCDNTNLPVSIKIRAGINPVKSASGGVATSQFNGVNAIEFIEKTKNLPYCTVMVHGRTYEGGFSGAVDWELISQIKKIIPEKIVLGNGGINTPEDACEVLQKYPEIDGLGIARGAWGRPWIFDQIKDLLKKIHPVKHAFGVPDSQEFNRVKKIMLAHAKLIYTDKAEMGKLEIRKHLVWYVKGFPGAAELRQKLVRAESLAEIRKILK